MEYKNWQDEIAFKFNYKDDNELKNNLEGILYSVLQFVCDNNLADELIEYLNESADYYLGDDFGAVNTELFEKWLGSHWSDGWD